MADGAVSGDGVAARRAPTGVPSSFEARLLDALVAQAPVGVVFFDRDGRFVLVNERLAEMNGVAVADHLGRTPAEVVPDLTDVAAEVHGRVMSGEERIEREVDGETPAAPGQVRSWHETWFPVTGDGGEIVGAGAIIVETTQRRRAAARAEVLAQVTTRLARARTRHDVARAVIRPVAELLGAHGGLMVLADDGEEGLDVISIDGYPEAAMAALDGSVPLSARLPITEAVRTGAPVFVESRSGLDAMARDAMSTAAVVGDHAWACEPIHIDGRVIGAWGVSFDHPRHLDSDDRQFLGTVAGICAGAMVRAIQFERARATSLLLQHSLLPTQLAQIDGYDVSARYRATTAAEVGGDWYDVISPSHPSGVAFSVGDVTGHSVEAAAVMGRVRNRLVGLAALEPRPGPVLAQLNDIVAPEHGFATALFGRLDPESGAVAFASAGHPPPLVHRRGATDAAWEVVSPAPPIGVPWTASPQESSFMLDPGDTLVLVTDGLYEERGADLDASLDRVAVEAAAALADGGDLGAACDRVIDALFEARDQDDDVCLLAIRRRP